MNLYRLFNGTFIVIALVFLPTLSFAEPDHKIVIFAAASLTNAIDEFSNMYEKESKIQIQPLMPPLQR